MAATLLLFTLLTASAGLRLAPVDQCGGDASFVQFRKGLEDAVERKDARAILDSLDEQVQVDLGGGQGRAAFAETWRLDRPAESPLWSELRSILRLGCALSGEARVLPSLIIQFDASLDAYETLVAMGRVVLRAAPSDDAPAVARLHWDVLTTGDDVSNDGWYQVRLRDGRHGFVRRDHVRSPIDYRMTVERVNGRWTITSFIAGD